MKKIIRVLSCMMLASAEITLPFLAPGTSSALASQPQPNGTNFSWVSSSVSSSTSTSTGEQISYDGRYVAFSSDSPTLIPNDTNGVSDIFVKDNQTSQIERVSVANDGSQYTGVSTKPVMSYDGRYIAFVRTVNNIQQTYVRDRVSGTTVLASSNASGTASDKAVNPLSISDTGVVLLNVTACNLTTVLPLGTAANCVYKKTLSTGAIQVLPFTDPTGHGDSWTINNNYAALSADGNVVLLYAYDNTTNYNTGGVSPQQIWQVVADNLTNNTSQIASTPASGTAPTKTVSIFKNSSSIMSGISRNGRYVLFATDDTHLISSTISANVYMRDLQTGSLMPIDQPLAGHALNGSYSTAGSPMISDDGRYVGFSSLTTDLDPIYKYNPGTNLTANILYVRDTISNTSRMVVNELSGGAAYAPGANKFAFTTSDSLNPGDAGTKKDVYIAYNGASQQQPLGSNGFAWVGKTASQGSGSGGEQISYDGRYVSFNSDASDLVPNDTNTASDIFVKDNQTGQTERVSVANDGSEFNGNSSKPAMSSDGRYVAFAHMDAYGIQQTYVRDRTSGTTTLASSNTSGVASDINAMPLSVSSTGLVLINVPTCNTTTILPSSTTSNCIYLKNITNGVMQVMPFVDPTGHGDSWTINNNLGAISSDGSIVVLYAYDNTTNYNYTGSGYPVQIFQVVAVNLTNNTAQIASTPASGGVPTNFVHMYQNDAGIGGGISRNGRYVMFVSTDSHLLSSTITAYIYMRDLQTGSLKAIDQAPSGQTNNGGDASGGNPMISDDGRYVGFGTAATNLDITNYNPNSPTSYSNLYVRDTVNSTTKLVVSQISAGGAYAPGASKFAFKTLDSLDSSDTAYTDVYQTIAQ